MPLSTQLMIQCSAASSYSQGRLSNSNRVQYYFWGPNANYNSVHTLSFLIMLSGKERECALTMLSRVGERVNTVL